MLQIRAKMMTVNKTQTNKHSVFTREARFFSSAREAWKACLSGIAPRRVLVPSYVGQTDREGSGVLDPLEDLGISWTFYDVGQDLQACPQTISRALDSAPDFDVVLVVHYFGWPAGDLAQIRALCDKRGVTLIEDCAHAFQWGLTEQVLGLYGHYAFYSIHKHLPVSTGGILHSVTQSFPLIMEPANQQAPFDVVEMVANSQLEEIANIRRSNASYLLDLLSERPGLRLMKQDIPVVPHSFPILLDQARREAVYFALLKRGIPTTALYYRLHPSIEKSAFPSSHVVSDSILNLPIHQDVSREGLQFMAESLSEVLEEF